MEVVVKNVNDPAHPIVLGSAKGNLRHLIAQFDEIQTILFKLERPNRTLMGELRLTAVITEYETAFGTFMFVCLFF